MKKGSYNRRRPAGRKPGKKQDQLVRKKRRQDPFAGLQYIADQLNALRTPEKLGSDERDAWDLAERVASGVVPDPLYKPDTEHTTILGRVSPPSLETAVDRFNMYFAHDPVRLCLWPPAKGYDLEVLPGFEAPKESKAPRTAMTAAFLWWHFFHDEGWKRVHRCQECRKWIVARGRNKVIRFCSPDCTWKHWNWKQRENHPNRANAIGARKRKKGIQR